MFSVLYIVFPEEKIVDYDFPWFWEAEGGSYLNEEMFSWIFNMFLNADI